MPFKSKAQVRKLLALASKGEISKTTLQEFKRETKSIKALPERVGAKPRSKGQRRMIIT